MEYFNGHTIQSLTGKSGTRYCVHIGKITGSIINAVIEEVAKSGVPVETAFAALAPATSHIVFALSNLPKDNVQAEAEAITHIGSRLTEMLEAEDLVSGQ